MRVDTVLTARALGSCCLANHRAHFTFREKVPLSATRSDLAQQQMAWGKETRRSGPCVVRWCYEAALAHHEHPSPARKAATARVERTDGERQRGWNLEASSWGQDRGNEARGELPRGLNAK